MIILNPQLPLKIKQYMADIDKVEYVQPDSFLVAATQNHPDLSILKIGESVIVDESQSDLIEKISGWDIHRISSPESNLYPDDCHLNFTVIGKYIVGNNKALTDNLLNIIKSKKLIFVNSSQGYAKCSTVVLNDKTVITDDESLHRCYIESDINSLLICKGDVCLPGYNYGFIGGASAVIDDNVIFFGNIKNHRDYAKIKSFIQNEGFRIISFDDIALTDYGGAIIL